MFEQLSFVKHLQKKYNNQFYKKAINTWNTHLFSSDANMNPELAATWRKDRKKKTGNSY